MTMKTRIAVLTLLAAMASAASAQTPAVKVDEHSAHNAPAAASGDATEGEVRKIDKGAGRITLKHGLIPNLEMTPMTMVFRVKDPAMLDAVKVGDKVRFRAEKVQGAITLIEIRSAK